MAAIEASPDTSQAEETAASKEVETATSKEAETVASKEAETVASKEAETAASKEAETVASKEAETAASKEAETATSKEAETVADAVPASATHKCGSEQTSNASAGCETAAPVDSARCGAGSVADVLAWSPDKTAADSTAGPESVPVAGAAVSALTQSRAEQVSQESASPVTSAPAAANAVSSAAPAPAEAVKSPGEVAPPEDACRPPPASVSDVPHHIKWVKFHGARTAIITQNVNGPCPLLALINVMLLKGKVQLPPALDVVTIGQLMDYVGDAILDTIPEQAQPDFEQNMQDAVAILPKLQTGLDVNVKFSGVQQFEYTSECCIFDLLHVRLYHGWLVDPAAADLHSAVAPCGYNQLVDKVITHKSSDDAALAHQALLAESFLETTASQLTEYGLAQLTCTMQEGQLAVFFRNNHFSTIYKYQDLLYLLVTDQGFLRETGVVWETLSSTTGAGQFVDGHFQPLSAEQTPAPSEQQIDRDFLVALSLQEESTRQQAQDLQWEEYKHAELGGPEDTVRDEELARRLQLEEERAAREEQQQQQQQRRPSQPDPAAPHALRPPTDSASARSDSKKKTCALM